MFQCHLFLFKKNTCPNSFPIYMSGVRQGQTGPKTHSSNNNNIHISCSDGSTEWAPYSSVLTFLYIKKKVNVLRITRDRLRPVPPVEVPHLALLINGLKYVISRLPSVPTSPTHSITNRGGGRHPSKMRFHKNI